MILEIPIVDMNEELMNRLELMGVIEGIQPGKHRLIVPKGTSKHRSIYESDDRFGGHKLITVSVNKRGPLKFIYHNDNEDFILMDQLEREPLILTVALKPIEELKSLIEKSNLSVEDFVAIRCKTNQPYMSYFTMKKGFAHSENVINEGDDYPSFYVTESKELDECIVDLVGYKIDIKI